MINGAGLDSQFAGSILEQTSILNVADATPATDYQLRNDRG